MERVRAVAVVRWTRSRPRSRCSQTASPSRPAGCAENLTAARNHRTLELYALFIHALALPELDVDGELLEFALSALDRNLDADFRADGVHVEASTHYHLIVLRSFVGVRVNARRFGARSCPPRFDERLQAALEFAMHCHRPDGQIPALADADSGSYAELLSLAAGELRASRLPATSRPRGARDPRRGAQRQLPRGGYHVQRSGWGEGDSALRGRAVSDLRLRAARRRRTRSLRPACPSSSPPAAVRWCSIRVASPITRASPTCVTGSRARARTTPSASTARPDRVPPRQAQRAVAHGRLHRSHRAPGSRRALGAEAISPRYDARHAAQGDVRRRRVLGVRGPALCRRVAHRYDLRWHLAPEALGDRRAAQPTSALGARSRAGARVRPGPSSRSRRAGTRLATGSGIRRRSSTR